MGEVEGLLLLTCLALLFLSAPPSPSAVPGFKAPRLETPAPFSRTRKKRKRIESRGGLKEVVTEEGEEGVARLQEPRSWT